MWRNQTLRSWRAYSHEYNDEYRKAPLGKLDISKDQKAVLKFIKLYVFVYSSALVFLSFVSKTTHKFTHTSSYYLIMFLQKL